MRFFSVFLASAIIALALSQNNCQNPLLAAFNITGLDAPISGAGLPYCNYLKGASTCCSADTVAGFQARADALVQSLQALAGQRDQQTVIDQAGYLDQFRDAYSDLTDQNSDLDDLKDDNAQIGDEAQAQYNLFGDINGGLDDIDGDDFNEDFRDIQRKRVACFNALLQIQASAWCLACDPNYNVGGVQADGTVAFSPALCNVISSACAPFVAATDRLSPIFRASQGLVRLNNLTQYLKDYSDNDHNVPNYIIDGFVPVNNASQQTNTLPAGCDGDSCPWQCSNLFTPYAQLNQVIVGNGAGLIGGTDLVLAPIGQVSTPGGVVTTATQIDNVTAPVAVPAPVDTVLPDNTTVPVDQTTPVDVVAPVNTTAPVNATDVAPGATWAPNLADSGLLFNVVADPAGVSGIQGNGQGDTDTDGNPSDTDDLNTP